MIFQHTYQLVLSGEKTQTRRLVKHDQWLHQTENPFGGWLPLAVVTHNKGRATIRQVYAVGSDYAVQPGRGKAAVARIRITGIRREDVRNITPEDAAAEGFVSSTHFMLLWTKMHDPEHYKRYPTTGQQSLAWDNGVLWARPAERYQAWALTFEVTAGE